MSTETAQDATVLQEGAGELANGFISVGGASTPDIRTPVMEEFIDRYTKIDFARLTLRDNGDCSFIVERQTEFAREHVSSATRNDCEPRGSSREALDRFIDGAVATRDDHVTTAIARGACCDFSSVTWTSRQFHIDCNTK